MNLDDYKKLVGDLDDLGDAIRSQLSCYAMIDKEETGILIEANVTNSTIEDLSFRLNIQDKYRPCSITIIFDTGGMNGTYVFLHSVTPSTPEDEYPMVLQLGVYSIIGDIIEKYLQKHLLEEGEIENE